MDVTSKVYAKDRGAWRAWLEAHHDSCTEIWLVYRNADKTRIGQNPEPRSISYLDSVEEAICFGWIDGIQKRISPLEKAQRFTPRRRRSNWTELNKERARRLIRLGLMTEAGMKTLPDLDAPFVVADDILEALKAEPDAWQYFQEFPALYIRVRIGYIEEMRRKRDEFERRLNNFLRKTASGKMFGNWNDQNRLSP